MSALGIRTIIVATDLTDALIPALQASVRLAKLTDAHLHIIHTTEARIPESRLTEHLAAAHVDTGPSIEARIMVGPPGALLVQDAVRLNADVIVLGPHQPGRSSLGSTAYRVVLGSQTPCLMLPAPLSLPLQRVLVPVDTSTSIKGLLQVALTWANALRQRERPTEFVALSVKSEVQSDSTEAQSLMHEVEAICQPLHGCTGLDIRYQISNGVPADEILDTAERCATDLIVMGTRGENLQRDALGSVSREVVIRARRPVLLVPRDVWKPAE
ncbi:MAG TPA: universal stress protein [Longimicrobiales bacterium]